MSVLIDPPMWPAHGRVWSHLASDTDLEELHRVARRAGIDTRLFEGDHYDVPQERYADAVAAGALEVSGAQLARRLRDSGLRFRKRRGERPLARRADGLGSMAPTPHLLEVVASDRERHTSGAAVVLVGTAADDRLVLVRQHPRGWGPPGGKRDTGDADVRQTAVREIAEEVGLTLRPGELTPVGYERITVGPGGGTATWDEGDNYLQVYAVELPAPLPLTPDLTEVLEARWCTPEEARRLGEQEPWWPLVDWWCRHRSP